MPPPSCTWMASRSVTCRCASSCTPGGSWWPPPTGCRRRWGRLPSMEATPSMHGRALYGRGRRRIGTVDAEFADYLLVRTAGLLPVDLYVPRPEVTPDGDRLTV